MPPSKNSTSRIKSCSGTTGRPLFSLHARVRFAGGTGTDGTRDVVVTDATAAADAVDRPEETRWRVLCAYDGDLRPGTRWFGDWVVALVAGNPRAGERVPDVVGGGGLRVRFAEVCILGTSRIAEVEGRGEE